jgi:GAF domain-containing protein
MADGDRHQDSSFENLPKGPCATQNRHILDQSARPELLNNLCQGLEQINDVIHQLLHERHRLFEESCRAAVELGGFKLAWVGLIDPDTLWIRPIAKAGEAGRYVEQIAVSVDPSLAEGHGLSGRAVQEDRQVIVNDFQADPSVARWHEVARKIGIKAAGVFPLRQRGHPVGVFKLYAAQVDFFDSDLVDLLRVMTRHINFALDKLEYRKVELKA